ESASATPPLRGPAAPAAVTPRGRPLAELRRESRPLAPTPAPQAGGCRPVRRRRAGSGGAPETRRRPTGYRRSRWQLARTRPGNEKPPRTLAPRRRRPAPPPLAGKTRLGAEARRAYEETRVRGMRRVAAKAPVATSTRPSIAAAPIAKSPHTNPFSATVTAGGVLATAGAPR